MPSRIEIRHAVVDAINTVAGIQCFYQQHITDLTDAMPCAVVAFDSIEVQEDMKGGRRYIGSMNILAFMSGFDDDIDPMVDQIIAATDLAIAAPSPLGTAWTLNSITYDHEIQPGTTGCTVNYSIWFTDDG
jgi:hypothetical protein